MDFESRKAELFAEVVAEFIDKMSDAEINVYKNILSVRSQMPEEIYEFNEDGSINFKNCAWLARNYPEEYLGLSEDEVTSEDIQDFVDDCGYFDSIDELVNSDLSWFLDLDATAIKNEVNKRLNKELADDGTELVESVEIHDTLNPKIWTDENKLIPEVRDKIIRIAKEFKDQLTYDNVALKVIDIWLLGSNANYNYNEDSDLDIHLIADESFDCHDKHLPIIYQAYKTLFNRKYHITIKGIDVELYVENKDQLTNVSSGIYSLKKGWIRKPSRYQIPDIDQNAVDEMFNRWENRYFDITLNPTLDKIDNYIDDIYDLRINSIKEDGEFGIGNLVFKEIRRFGYLEDLKNLRTDLMTKELSLESLNTNEDD